MIIRHLSLSATLGVALAIGTPAHGQTPTEQDVAAGNALARDLCVNCHVVAVDQATIPRGREPAPNFATIARRPDVSAQSLRQFLTTTHATIRNPTAMPSPELSDAQLTPLI